jgi:hypothetical protein
LIRNDRIIWNNYYQLQKSHANQDYGNIYVDCGDDIIDDSTCFPERFWDFLTPNSFEILKIGKITNLTNQIS